MPFPEKIFAILSHDTFCHYPRENGQKELNPCNYVTKSVLLPQFKSIIGAVGANNLLGEVFNLIQLKIIGKDINGILTLEGAYMKNYLLEKKAFGTVTLCGYNELEGTFEVFAIEIKEGIEAAWADCQVVVLPSFIQAAVDISKLSNPVDQLAGKAIEIIKNYDDQLPINEQAGIGGQIIVNVLQLDKKHDIFYDCFIHHTYSDYEIIGEKMLDKSKSI